MRFFLICSILCFVPALTGHCDPGSPASPQPISPMVAAAPESVSVSATIQTRPFFKSTLRGLADYGASPLHLQLVDLAWLAPAAALTGVLVNNDVAVNNALAKGDARKDWLDHSMPGVSALGDGFTEFTVAALLSKAGSERLARTSATAMQGLVVVAVYAEVFKYAAWSNRPYEDDSAHRFLAYDQPTQGMPSGHSYSAFCMAEVYGAEYGRWITYPLAGLIAYSRVYNQAHWPSDVLVGSVLGIIVGVQARHWTEAGGPPAIHFSLVPTQNTPLLVANVTY